MRRAERWWRAALRDLLLATLLALASVATASALAAERGAVSPSAQR